MQRRLDEKGDPAHTFPVRDGFVDHPLLKPGLVQAREFQTRVAQRVLEENTLVVVPTGMGKTLIAVLAAAELLRRKGGTVLFMAPTRPLAAQHADTFVKFFRDEGLVRLLSGTTAPDKRAELWRQGLFVVATPQTIRNDLKAGRYDLSPLTLVIFDEAHRAVGDYAYVDLSARLRLDNPGARILALTASPGAARERVREVRANLGVTATEAREATSEDVAPYMQEVTVVPHVIPLTPIIRRVTKPLHELLAEKEQSLRDLGSIRGERRFGPTKRELIAIQQSAGRSGHFAKLHQAALAYYARLSIDYAEVYGLDTLRRHLERLRTKTDRKRNESSFVHHPKVQETWDLLSKGIEESHPKEAVLVEILQGVRRRRADLLAMVFTQYRDSIPGIQAALSRAGFEAQRFVGQADRGEEAGLDQAAQKQILDRFARREFPVLVSTSIGEEGIDVPQVDAVVFYDAVPSEIRSIQRRGRTGRTIAGQVHVLVAKDTSDEGAYKASQVREDKMRRLVGRMG